MVTLADSALADPALTRRHGARPAVQLTVAASTLLGLDEQPAELAGYGPIPAADGPAHRERRHRHVAAVAHRRPGRLLDYGSKTYRPPARLAAFIIARDQTCTFASCTRPAVACDLDHLKAAKDGGPTCPGNLHPLCRRHHRCKHLTHWQPQRQPDGSTVWTSPTGHTYRTQPPPLPTTVEPETADRHGPSQPRVTPSEAPTDDPDPPPF